MSMIRRPLPRGFKKSTRKERRESGLGTSYAETTGADPDGNIFDISTWGWSGRPLPKDKAKPNTVIMELNVR
jgi:hypothetical protein